MFTDLIQDFLALIKKLLFVGLLLLGCCLLDSQDGINGHMRIFGRTSAEFFNGGDPNRANPGEQHSGVTQDDGAVTLCSLSFATTVLSRNCCRDLGCSLTKEVDPEFI